MTEEGTVVHRGHRVWWGRAGRSGTKQPAPLLTIHGGPSLCHDYLEPTPKLGTIQAPTLVIGGTRDQCPPEIAEKLAAGIPNAELAVLEAAHLPFFEVPEEYLDLIRSFLTRVEARG